MSGHYGLWWDIIKQINIKPCWAVELPLCCSPLVIHLFQEKVISLHLQVHLRHFRTTEGQHRSSQCKALILKLFLFASAKVHWNHSVQESISSTGAWLQMMCKEWGECEEDCFSRSMKLLRSIITCTVECSAALTGKDYSTRSPGSGKTIPAFCHWLLYLANEKVFDLAQSQTYLGKPMQMSYSTLK